MSAKTISLIAAAGLAVACVSLVFAQRAAAAILNVTTTQDETTSGDLACSLREGSR